MKQAVTLRLDPTLLAEAKRIAGSENRTLTNFVETLLKTRIGSTSIPNASRDSSSSRTRQPASRHKASPSVSSDSQQNG